MPMALHAAADSAEATAAEISVSKTSLKVPPAIAGIGHRIRSSNSDTVALLSPRAPMLGRRRN
ncbi:hypothetical protein SSBR45R_42140 [Bradyrhizobium sp. SSBR45R]|nr:hypothetical protein SSBR45R_42140 [Bradyrhizobium sp. SSBR45R]